MRVLQQFSTYFGDEHSRLLALWRSVVSIRRGFTELKSATQRDLTNAMTDVQVYNQYLYNFLSA